MNNNWKLIKRIPAMPPDAKGIRAKNIYYIYRRTIYLVLYRSGLVNMITPAVNSRSFCRRRAQLEHPSMTNAQSNTSRQGSFFCGLDWGFIFSIEDQDICKTYLHIADDPIVLPI